MCAYGESAREWPFKPFKETLSSVVSRNLDLNRTRLLADVLASTQLETDFPDQVDYVLPQQLQQVAKLIKAGVQGGPSWTSTEHRW